MKRFLALFLSLLLFLEINPIALAAGINKEEVLSDGTVLRYVSTESIEEAHKSLLDRIEKNRSRKLSTGKNVGIKAVSAGLGALFCWAESKIKNKYLRYGLMAVTAIASLAVFFYPEYISYDVNQVENHKMQSELYGDFEGTSAHYLPKREGLNGLLDCLDQCINYNFDLYKDTGIIIVERPDGFRNTDWESGIYRQNPDDINRVHGCIEAELRRSKM